MGRPLRAGVSRPTVSPPGDPRPCLRRPAGRGRGGRPVVAAGLVGPARCTGRRGSSRAGRRSDGQHHGPGRSPPHLPDSGCLSASPSRASRPSVPGDGPPRPRRRVRSQPLSLGGRPRRGVPGPRHHLQRRRAARGAPTGPGHLGGGPPGECSGCWADFGGPANPPGVWSADRRSGRTGYLAASAGPGCPIAGCRHVGRHGVPGDGRRSPWVVRKLFRWAVLAGQGSVPVAGRTQPVAPRRLLWEDWQPTPPTGCWSRGGGWLGPDLVVGTGCPTSGTGGRRGRRLGPGRAAARPAVVGRRRPGVGRRSVCPSRRPAAPSRRGCRPGLLGRPSSSG